jgi:nucleotide-binding universal stress UspA family protein
MTMIGESRRVVLGVSGHRTAHLVDWAARLLWPGDCVQVVHVYRPIPYAATDWQLPMDEDVLLRELAHRQVPAAAARLRRFRPDLMVSEELAGDAIDIALAEAARAAELMLLGIPHSERNRHMLERLLAEVDCPVILIGPADPAPTSAVAAVLRGDASDDAVLWAAFEQAQRKRCGLLVLKRWQPPLDGNLRYAETAEQKSLDSYVAGWQERYRRIGVTAELRFGESLRELLGHGASADLLILALPRPNRARSRSPALDEVISHRAQPTMLIPEREPARSGVGGLPSARDAERR